MSSPASLADTHTARLDALIELTSISHGAFVHHIVRWVNEVHPDPEGEQLRAVRELLRERPKVRYVWMDWWCLYQKQVLPGQGYNRFDAHDDRTEEQHAEFATALKAVNLLYLGCTVFVLPDLSYQSRFWVRWPLLYFPVRIPIAPCRVLTRLL